MPKVGRRHSRLTPGMDATREHVEYLFGRETRRALRALAQAMRIDLTKCKSTIDVWKALTEKVESGIGNPRDPIVGDPFGVFVTGKCWDGHDKWEQIAVHKTGHMVDEFEAKKIANFLKHEDPVRHCDCPVESGGGCQCPPEQREDANGYCRRCDMTINPLVCGKPITTWSVDNTRINTFGNRNPSGRPIMEARGSQIRGLA